MSRVFAWGGDTGLVASEAAPDVRDRRAPRPAPALVGSHAAGVRAHRGHVDPALPARVRHRPSSAVFLPPLHDHVALAVSDDRAARTRLVAAGCGGRLGQSAWRRPHGARRDRRVVGRRAVCLARDMAGPRGSAFCRWSCLSPRLIVNPWGPAILEFLRGAVSARPELTEWNPIEFAGLEGALYGTALVLAVLGCTGRWRPRWPAMVVVACTAVAPLLARRHLPFFVLATAVLACPSMVRHVQDLVAARWPSAMAREEGPPWRWPVVSVLFLEASLLLVLSVPRIRCITVEAGHYPIAAVTTLKAAGATGRIATFFDWGGFVLDTLGPQLQVSMDPRRETVYGGEAYGLNEQFMLGLGDWDALLVHEPRPDLALVSKAFPTFNLMRSRPGWSLVIEDQAGGLFVRDESALAAAVRRAATGGSSARGPLFRGCACMAWRLDRTTPCGTRRRVAAPMNATSPPRGAIVTVYAVAVALGATLLFLIQPMFARVVLPPLGGAPAVWTTSVLFFQVLLLAAYLYAHALGRNGFTPASAALHLVVVAAGVLWLPLDIGWTRTLAAGSPPAWRLVVAATAALGLPLFAVAATAPLVQRWFTAIDPAQGGSGIRALCREQRRQPGRPPGVSAHRRAPLHAEYTEPAVAGRLYRAGRCAWWRPRSSRIVIDCRRPSRAASSRRPASGAPSRGDSPSAGSFEPLSRRVDAERHALPDDRHRGESAALGAAALRVSAVVRDRVRAAADSVPVGLVTVDRSGRWARRGAGAADDTDPSGVAAAGCSPGRVSSCWRWAVTSRVAARRPPATSPDRLLSVARPRRCARQRLHGAGGAAPVQRPRSNTPS